MKVAKRLAWFLVTALAVAGVVHAGGQAAPAAGTPQKKRELVLAHHQAQSSLVGQGMDRVAKTFNDSCDTAFITVFHNSELGSINQLLEAVSAGTIDINPNGFGQASNLYRPLEVFSMPYMAKTSDDIFKIMDLKQNPVLQEIVAGFEKASNVHVITTTASVLARHLTCNFPVYKPSDLAGHKVRSITSEIFTIAVQGLGGVPVPIDWAEAPTALSTGVIEGQENPYSILSDYQLWDVQKYIMETGHQYDTSMFMINQKSWDSLSANERTLLERACDDFNSWTRQYNIDQLAQYKKNCVDNGMTIITAAEGLQVDEFKTNTQRLLVEKFPHYADYLNRINQFMGY